MASSFTFTQRAWALLSAALQAQARALKERPYAANAATSALLMCAGDRLAQHLERGDEWDEGILTVEPQLGPAPSLAATHAHTSAAYQSWTRTSILTVWAACIGAPFWVTWYRMLANRMAGRTVAMVAATAMIAPAWNAAFFSWCTAAEHFAYHPTPLATIHQLGPAIADKLFDKLPKTLAVSTTVWPLINYLNFAYVPLHLRNVVASACAFLWNIFLSLQQHGTGRRRATAVGVPAVGGGPESGGMAAAPVISSAAPLELK